MNLHDFLDYLKSHRCRLRSGKEEILYNTVHNYGY